MITKLKALWAQLPHQLQAGITAVAGSFVATFVHALSEGGCYTSTCLKHYAGTAIAAALVTLRVFYMMPNHAPGPNGKNY